MENDKSVRFVSGKTSATPNESIQTTDVAAGELLLRKTNKNKNFMKEASGRGFKVFK